MPPTDLQECYICFQRVLVITDNGGTRRFAPHGRNPPGLHLSTADCKGSNRDAGKVNVRRK